jgi:hypothetical protein
MHKLFSKTSAQLTATVAVGAVVYKNFTHSNPSAHAHLAVGSNSSRLDKLFHYKSSHFLTKKS